MKVTVKNLPKSQVMLTIEVPEDQLKKAQEKAMKQLSMNLKVPGFRPGHIPPEVVQQHVRPEVLLNQTLELVLPDTYSAAIFEHKLQVVSRPTINILTTEPLAYEATVAVYPEVKVSGYEKAKIDKKEVKVTDQEIEDVLKEVQKRHATYHDVDCAAQKGDRVELDFEGFDEGGAALEKTKSTNHPLIIGEGSLVPGFEEELIGLKKDEKKSFKVTFPKDYFHKPFMGKVVEFRVEVKRVEERKMPEWTPELIQQMSPQAKTLDELKIIINENLLHDKKHAEKVRRENEFLDAVINHSTVDVPEILIEEELDSMIEEFKSELQQMRVPFEEYLKQNKKELKDLRDERRKEAEKRLTLRFGLQQIFQQEKLDVTKEELQKEVDHIVGLYPANEQEKVKAEYQENNYVYRRLENKLKMDKLFERFLGKE